MNDSMTREEAIKKLTQLKNKFLDEYIDYNGTTSAYDMAIEALSQPERKNGKWINCGNIYAGTAFVTAGYTVFRCSECGGTHNRTARFCPNCGAKIETESEG